MAYYPQKLKISRSAASGMPQMRGGSTTMIQVAGATATRIVPTATVAAVTETITAAAPAGGTGANAGGWDTAANRDTSILAINETKTLLEEESVAMAALTADVLALKKCLTALIDACQTLALVT